MEQVPSQPAKMGEHGFSLVETMVAAAIFAGGMLAVSQAFSNLDRMGMVSRYSAAQTLVYEQVQQAAESPLALRSSSTNGTNSALRQCLGLAPGACNRLVANDLILHDTAGAPVTGTPGAPRFYGFDGSPCAAAGPNCPIQATSRIVALCRNPVGVTCPVPNDVAFQIYYSIQVVDPAAGALPVLGPAVGDGSLPVPARATRILAGF